MIEADGNAKALVDARFVLRGNAVNALRLHEGQQLVASDIEEDVADRSAFGDPNQLVDHHLEAQNLLVKRSGRLHVQRRQTDMRKSFVAHFTSPWILGRSCDRLF